MSDLPSRRDMRAKGGDSSSAEQGHRLGKAHYDKFGNYLGHPQFDASGEYVAHAMFDDDGKFLGHMHYEDEEGNPVIPTLDDSSRDTQEYSEEDDEPVVSRKRKRRGSSALVLLVAVVLIAVGALFVAKILMPGMFGGNKTSDYAGPGHSAVEVVVNPGDSGTAIAGSLVDAGVIASKKAFVSAYTKNPEAAKLAPGTYKLKLEMSAQGALAALLDSANRVELKLVVPEGFTQKAVFERIQSLTGITVADLEAAATSPEVGLPPEAGGKIEGWLFPATYVIAPKATPVSILKPMVAKTISVLDARGVAPADREKVLTIASIIEAEMSSPSENATAYYGMASRVIANRLEKGIPLGMDTVIAYGLKKRPLDLTTADLANDGPYGSRKQLGLPPTPIGNPGEATLTAALNPTPGDWLYFVTVNLKTGETKFTADYNEFLTYVAEYQKYMETYKE